MLKAYKYRIYPNSEQRTQITKTFGCCRFVYNRTLVYRKEIYEKEKKSVSKTDCNNYCNRELKKDYEWLKEVDKFALTNAIYNMDSAYQKYIGQGLPELTPVEIAGNASCRRARGYEVDEAGSSLALDNG